MLMDNSDSEEDLEPQAMTGWPRKFYEVPLAAPLECDDPNIADYFVDTARSTSEESTSENFCAAQKYPRTDQCKEDNLNLLDLPQLVLEKILYYLCCDEPNNRCNRNLRNFAATCSELTTLVNQSFVPEYLELGINYTVSGVHKEHEVYSRFLDQVNWKISKLRLVVTISPSFASTTFDGHIHIVFHTESLPIIKSFYLDGLILDFSQFYVISEIEEYTSKCFIYIDLDDILMKMPKLRSLTFIPMEDQRHADPSIVFLTALRHHPLQHLCLDDVFSSRNKECWYFTLRNLNAIDNYENLKHVSFDILEARDLYRLAKLPRLTSLACSKFMLEFETDYSNLDEYDPPVFNKVLSVVIRHAFDYRRQSFFMPKMFPNLETYETCFTPHKDVFEGMKLESLRWWTFRTLASVSIFLQKTDFSEHLCSLKALASLKNLSIESVDMKTDYTSVLKIFDREGTVDPMFNLELLRLESQNPDYEVDVPYTTKLLPDVLLFQTLKVLIISSYHTRQQVPEHMQSLVNCHSGLLYVTFGCQILRRPNNNKDLLEKHKWCRPRLYLS